MVLFGSEFYRPVLPLRQKTSRSRSRDNTILRIAHGSIHQFATVEVFFALLATMLAAGGGSLVAGGIVVGVSIGVVIGVAVVAWSLSAVCTVTAIFARRTLVKKQQAVW